MTAPWHHAGCRRRHPDQLMPSKSGTRAPGPLLLHTDYARSAVEFGSLFWAWPALARAPRGDGHPVLVVPGLVTDDATTFMLRTFLGRLGYRTYGWGLGRNIGPTAKAVHGLRARLDRIRAQHAQPVSVIGWSLGGIYARQLARRSPDAVRLVITLGSPIRLEHHQQSNARRLFHRYADLHIERWALPLEDGCGPLPVPATAVYSRLDGVVTWRTCLDQPSPLAENVEVRASHLGSGHHPAVLWLVADRLAQPRDAWTPFRPPRFTRLAYPRPVRDP